VVRDALGAPGLSLAAARAAMLEATRFVPFPDAAPALRTLRERGVRLVVASNWDCSLPQVLEDAGLRALVDGVVSSASVGADKPAPAVFEAALALAGCGPEDAVHVGDSVESDVVGAQAAGVRALLIDRDSDGGDIRSLAELPRVLSAG
jgi:putative hydrolase of the HAD superfamily